MENLKKTIDSRMRELLVRSPEEVIERGLPPTPAMIVEATPVVMALEALLAQPAHLVACYDQEFSAEWWHQGLKISYGLWPNGEQLLYVLEKGDMPSVVDETEDMIRGIAALQQALLARREVPA